MIGSANAGYTFSGAVFPFGVVSFSPEELASSATKRNTPGFSL
jgi:putative alpha-1,2-mannosidase